MLVGLAILFLAISWRRWCDPLIDFGDQLYTAWRLSNGAVLYRDVDLLYGPLSQYVNAALFAVFGPGIMVLVAANLAVFVAIVSVLYMLCRRAWGVTAALIACAIFVSVFGFSQFVHFANLNYATPYSQETTHGMLVCLLLCLVLARWIEFATSGRSFVAGGLFGLSAVLKPEFMFAAGAMTLVAGLTRWRYGRIFRVRTVIVWTIGVMLPTAAFVIYFAMSMSWTAAASAACHAWLSTLRPTYSRDFLQMGFLGLDQPWLHLKQHVFATLFACFVTGMFVAIVWLAEKSRRPFPLLSLCVVSVVAFGWLACFVIEWIEIGRCLLGLMSIYACVCAVSVFRRKDGEENIVDLLRLLLAVLAVALMARMLLNGRIYHYGYYQAALAAVIAPAIIIGELPTWLSATWRGRAVTIISALALLFPGVVILARRSQNEFGLKTIRVGTGRDQFCAFPQQIDPTGEMVDIISGTLSQSSEGSTLLVLPEGEMINYLARLRNPIPQFFFYGGATCDGREAQIVEELKRQSPYWIVIISRDLGEYDIDRYGEKSGSGGDILRWVEENYKQVAAVGGDPLDYREHGALILRKYHP